MRAHAYTHCSSRGGSGKRRRADWPLHMGCAGGGQARLCEPESQPQSRLESLTSNWLPVMLVEAVRLLVPSKYEMADVRAVWPAHTHTRRGKGRLR